MGDVDRIERTGTAQGSGDAEADDRAAPGKRTRSEAVQRKAAAPDGGGSTQGGADPGAMMQALTSTLGGYVPASDRAVDVSGAASAAVGSAFGARAAGIDFTVGGGAASAIGANAVTTDRKVDFAPGQFDLGNPAGQARLGEETAHAVQQSNPGPASPVDALEGEAKRAGQDFAAGVAPNVTLAAPAGVGLTDDPVKPTAPIKDTDPSPEVPDLTHGEVTATKKLLTTDQPKALQCVLNALQRINATKFSTADLDGGKLHLGYGSSKTGQGPKFAAWFATMLEAFAKTAKKDRDKLSSDEVKKALKDTPPPADKRDLKVTIGDSFFESVSLLYSTVRHEFVHVEQMRADYTAFIGSSAMPGNTDQPDTGKLLQDREAEAYLWEMENLAKTGLKDPGDVHLVWEQCYTALINASPEATKKFEARFKAAYAAIWKLGVDGHVAAIGALYAEWQKSKALDAGKMDLLERHLWQFWNYKDKYDNDPKPFVTAHDAALKQLAEMQAVGKASEATKQLDAVDKQLKSGYTDATDAFNDWWALLQAYEAVDATGKKAIEARAKVTLPAVWDKAFSLGEAEITKQLKTDAEEADRLDIEIVGNLWTRRDRSFVVEATYADRRKKIHDAVVKAKKK